MCREERRKGGKWWVEEGGFASSFSFYFGGVWWVGSKTDGRFLLRDLGSRRLNAWIATLAGMMAMVLGDERRLFLATRLDRGWELPRGVGFQHRSCSLIGLYSYTHLQTICGKACSLIVSGMHTDSQNQLKHKQGAAVRYDHDRHSTPLSKCARRHRRLDRATSARSVHDPSGTPPAERSNSGRIER